MPRREDRRRASRFLPHGRHARPSRNRHASLNFAPVRAWVGAQRRIRSARAFRRTPSRVLTLAGSPTVPARSPGWRRVGIGHAPLHAHALRRTPHGIVSPISMVFGNSKPRAADETQRAAPAHLPADWPLGASKRKLLLARGKKRRCQGRSQPNQVRQPVNIDRHPMLHLMVF